MSDGSLVFHILASLLLNNVNGLAAYSTCNSTGYTNKEHVVSKFITQCILLM